MLIRQCSHPDIPSHFLYIILNFTFRGYLGEGSVPGLTKTLNPFIPLMGTARTREGLGCSTAHFELEC